MTKSIEPVYAFEVFASPTVECFKVIEQLALSTKKPETKRLIADPQINIVQAPPSMNFIKVTMRINHDVKNKYNLIAADADRIVDVKSMETFWGRRFGIPMHVVATLEGNTVEYYSFSHQKGHVDMATRYLKTWGLDGGVAGKQMQRDGLQRDRSFMQKQPMLSAVLNNVRPFTNFSGTQLAAVLNSGYRMLDVQQVLTPGQMAGRSWLEVLPVRAMALPKRAVTRRRGADSQPTM